ncbi:hypothetical protein DFH06DRAFT_1135603 [Mycena polygramma]|nr:hypothetical protein DFH06DRAFT_1135603 [Mycena polygramma]
MRMRQKERRTIRTDKRKYTYPPFTFLALKEQEQKAKERSGPIEPAEVGRQGSVGSLEGIRKAKVCRKMKRDTEVKPEKDRRDRRSTIEEEEDVEKGRMMTEATGGGRSIGSGETRKVNRDDRKRRKTEGRSKVDTEAHGGAKGRSVPERLKSRSSREGRKQEERGEEGKSASSSGSDSGPRPRKLKPERELENCHIVEFGLGSVTVQAGTGRKEGMWKETKECITNRDLIEAEENSAEGQDRRWRTRIGEWNEKSRSLMDQCSISEARRFGVGVVATSDKVRTSCSSAERSWPRAMDSKLRGSGPKSRKSGDASGIGDPVRRVSSEYGIRRWEVGSGTTTEEDWRKTAQEVLVQSESANNSSEEKSEFIGKARKFEMPIPPLRVDVPSSRVNGKPEYSGLLAQIEPEGPTGERREARRARDLTAGEKRLPECNGTGGQFKHATVQRSRGFRKSRSISRTKAGRRLERPKRMRECLEEFRWPERPKRNMTGRNRRTERVRKAMMDDGEYRRSGRGRKGNEAKTPRSAQWNKKSMEDLGKEKVNRKEQSNFQLRAAARSRNALNRSDAQPKTATVFGRRPEPSSERENGKETANGGVQPRTIPDAWAEASIGRSELTNGRLESKPRKGDEQRTEVQGTKRDPERKVKVNECQRGMDVGERKLLGGMNREVGRDSEAKQQGTSDQIPTEIRIRSGSESSEGKETRKEQREEVAMESTRESAGGMFTKNEKPGGGPSKAPKVWWSLGRCRPEGMTEVRRIRTKVGSNHIPTEIFGDIRICGGFKAVTQPTSCSNTPEMFGTKAEPRPRVPRGICREGKGSGRGADRKPEVSRTKLRRLDGTVGDVDQRDDRSPEDADKMSGGGTVRKQGPNGRTELRSDAAGTHNTREMSGAEGTETECSERVFAKSCEGNRRRAPEIVGGANRGLEGSTERDSRLNGASEMQGRKVTEIRRSRRKIWPGPGEDVWDFGKDVRAPERPESFSGASLGNRKSQNTIRTGVRVRASGDDNVGTTPERWKPSRSGISGRTTLRRRADRKIPSQSRAPTERIGDEPKQPDQPEGSGRSPREKARKEWKWRMSRTEPGEPDGPE